MYLAEKEQLIREIQQISDKVLEHKMHITQVLQAALEGVKATKENIEKAANDARTPGIFYYALLFRSVL